MALDIDELVTFIESCIENTPVFRSEYFLDWPKEIRTFLEENRNIPPEKIWDIIDDMTKKTLMRNHDHRVFKFLALNTFSIDALGNELPLDPVNEDENFFIRHLIGYGKMRQVIMTRLAAVVFKWVALEAKNDPNMYDTIHKIFYATSFFVNAIGTKRYEQINRAHIEKVYGDTGIHLILGVVRRVFGSMKKFSDTTLPIMSDEPSEVEYPALFKYVFKGNGPI